MQYRAGRGLSALVDRSNHKLARKSRLEKAVRPCLELMESRRLLSAGALDPTLDTDGIARAPVGSGDDFGQAVAVQGDGKIVVAGFTFDGFQQNVALTRFNSNGSLDSSFGGDGTVESVFGTPIVVNAVAIDGDGKIVVAGTAFGATGDFAVLRYNSDGTPDGTFGTGGLQTADFALGEENGAAVAIDALGNIVVAGTTNASDFAVARFDTLGQLDLSFGDGGKLTTDFSSAADNAFGVVIQNDTKIVVGGTSTVNGDQDFALTRYNSDGSTDTGFGVSGATFADFGGNEDIAFALALQADGKIVAAGNSDQFGGGASDFAVARFNTDGSEDVGFGSVTNIAGVLDVATDVAVGTDGKVVAAGYAFDGVTTVFSLVRYNSDGSLDGSFDDGFGASGVVTTQVGDAVHQTVGVAIQADGKIVIGGATNGVDFDFAVVRYESADAVNPPGASVINDPLNPTTRSALLVYGSENADIIVLAVSANGAVHGSFTGTLQFGALAPQPGKPFGRVIIHSLGGNDTIVAASVSLPIVVFAGSGADSVRSGGGNDILIGGDGADRLYAGGGNDLVVGGNGGDSLRGDAGNDILIAGTTDFDNDLLFLNDVSTGVITPSIGFMNDDAVRDTLTGSAGVDRFYANTTDTNILLTDIITDLSGTETWEDLV